jgi:hypothetical protein
MLSIREKVGGDRMEVIQRYVEKIDVFFDQDSGSHKSEMKLHLPIVGDKLKWHNPKLKKDGYTIYNGKDMKVMFLKKNVRMRSKEEVVLSSV